MTVGPTRIPSRKRTPSDTPLHRERKKTGLTAEGEKERAEKRRAIALPFHQLNPISLLSVPPFSYSLFILATPEALHPFALCNPLSRLQHPDRFRYKLPNHRHPASPTERGRERGGLLTGHPYHKPPSVSVFSRVPACPLYSLPTLPCLKVSLYLLNNIHRNQHHHRQQQHQQKKKKIPKIRLPLFPSPVPHPMASPSPPPPGLDPNTPPSPPPPHPAAINYVLGFLMVGLAWGLTTPFIRRAAKDHQPPPHPILSSDAVQRSPVRRRVYGALFAVLDLLRNPRYAVPLVLNLTGSVWFFLLIGKAGMYLFVPKSLSLHPSCFLVSGVSTLGVICCVCGLLYCLVSLATSTWQFY